MVPVAGVEVGPFPRKEILSTTTEKTFATLLESKEMIKKISVTKNAKPVRARRNADSETRQNVIHGRQDATPLRCPSVSFGLAGGFATPVLYDSYTIPDTDRQQKNVKRVKKN